MACRSLGQIFKALRRSGVDMDDLAARSGYSLEHLLNKHERITWRAYVRITEVAERVLSEEQMIGLGVGFLKSPLFAPMTFAGRLLFTAKDFYRWIYQPGVGAGNQQFTCVTPSYRDLGSNQIEVQVTIDEGYPPCRLFFLVSKGILQNLPRLVGEGTANVEMTLTDGGATYLVALPPPSVFARFRRAIAAPFAARVVARELKEANEVLKRRYEELEAARNLLDRQATQLRTANTIIGTIRGDLDLTRTVEGVVGALVDVAGFARVRLRLRTDLEGEPISMDAERGEVSSGEAVAVPVIAHEQEIATLEVWPRPGANIEERRELLSHVVPAIATALHDALTFTAVSRYRKTLEEKVEHRTAELRRLATDLEHTVDALKRAQEARDRIFANVNHEIRTPLSLILLSTSKMRRELASAGSGVQAPLDGIDSAVGRLLWLIDGILLLASSREQKLQLKGQREDLARLIGGQTGLWRVAAEEAGVTLSMELPERCEAFFDPAAIDRVFANLMSNALKFTPAGGRVAVRVERRDNEVYLEVRDSGVGIDPEFRKRMFGRFEQGRAAVRAGASGSGIGLAIVKELIEAHGGSIQVEDNRGGGSVFQVLLPIDGGPLAHAQGVERSSIKRISAPVMMPAGPVQAAGPQAPAAHLGATILVAEDDPALRQAVVDVLAAHYRVLAAPDGLAALELAKAKLPDMLVTDIGMPGMDGIELTRRFRELSGVRLAPVLVLTAYGTVGDRLLGFEAGAIDYVLKPFEPGELLARVRAQLAIRDMALRMHDLEKLAALGTMLSGLAHEFRNPANAVVNALGPIKQMLEHPDLEQLETARQLLDIAGIGATQINALSRQLLGFARPGEMTFAPVPLPELLHSATVLVPNLDNIKLERTLAFDGELQCNRSMIIQILTNLLDNAAYAAGPRGSVRVSCALQDGVALIDVKDSGPGISAELRERIFEPFFTTKPPGSGTGLGLSVSRRIAQRHGGDLRVLGSGADTVFRLQLPIAGPATAAAADTPHLSGSSGDARPGYTRTLAQASGE